MDAASAADDLVKQQQDLDAGSGQPAQNMSMGALMGHMDGEGYSYPARDMESYTGRQTRQEPPGSTALLPMWHLLDVDGNGRLSAREAAGLTKLLHVDWDLEEVWDDAIRLFEPQLHEAILSRGPSLDSDDAEGDAPAGVAGVMLQRSRSSLDLAMKAVKKKAGKGDMSPSLRAENFNARASRKRMDDEISFGSFVQVYNMKMGAQRRLHRLDVKAVFEKLDHDHSGEINKEQLAMLVKQSKKWLALLPPVFNLEQDWAYLTSENPSTDPDDETVGVSFREFERWWKNRCGMTEVDAPIIPEFFTFQLQGGSPLPRKPKTVSVLEPARGKVLWNYLRPKLITLAAMKMAWAGADGDMVTHSESVYDLTAIPPFIRDPDSTFSVVWDLLQIVFLLYVSVTVPYRACFEVDVELFSKTWFWDTMIDVYFVSDIVLNFRTAYVNSKGIREVNSRKIAQNYVTGWFILDFVSCIPVGHITTIIEHTSAAGADDEAGADNMKALKAIRLLRMSKLLRLARIKRILQKYESLLIVQEYMGIGFMVCTVVFVAHFLTCLWYLVGTGNQIIEVGKVGNGETTELSEFSAPILRGWVNKEPWYKPNSTEFSEYCTTGTRYTTSMYYVFNALDGANDPTPTDMEKVMAVVALICTIIIDGAVAGVIGSMLISMGGKDAEANDMLRGVKAWLNETRIPRAQSKKTFEYFQMKLKGISKTSDSEALESMPPFMKEEFCRHIYLKVLQSVPVFRGLSNEVLGAICHKLTPMNTMKGQVIYHEGSVGYELYMILDGEFEVSARGARLGFLSAGAFFGEVPFLDPNSGGERSRTVTSVTESRLCFIGVSQMDELKEHYPALDLVLRRFARGGNKQRVGSSRLKGRKLAQASLMKQTLISQGVHTFANMPVSHRRQGQGGSIDGSKSPTSPGGGGAFAKLKEKIETQTATAIDACLDDFVVKLDGLVRAHNR